MADVDLYRDGSAFLRAAEEFLSQEALTSNVVGAQVNGVLTGLRTQGEEDVWAVVTESGRVVGVGMWTPPHPFFLSRMPRDAVDRLARSLLGAGLAIEGVSGEQHAVRSFCDTWVALRAVALERVISMRMYRLDQLRAPAGVAGAHRIATLDDSAIVLEWLEAFEVESFPPGMVPAPPEFSKKRLANGEFLLWVVDTEPVALAGYRPPAAGVSRIGPVFTPMRDRRRGYGSAVTAAAAAVALEGGATDVALYADLGNTTSNSIYQAIGFVPDHDVEEWRALGQE